MLFGHGRNTLNATLFPKGCQLVRLHDSLVSWSDISCNRGVYNWANLDAHLAAAEARGLQVIYTICYTPSWAAQLMTGVYPGVRDATSNRPPNLQDFVDFVTALVAHVRRSDGTLRIKYFEGWNEPNALGFWCGTDAQLLAQQKALYQIVKAADLTAMVLTPSPCLNSTTVDQVIDRYLTAGFQSYANIIAFHGYVVDGASGSAIGLTLDAINAVMTRHGCRHPLWNTEFGFSATGHDTIPDAQKAQWLRDSLITQMLKNVQAAIWYVWDSPIGFNPMCNSSGVLNTSGTAWVSAYNSIHPFPSVTGIHQL